MTRHRVTLGVHQVTHEYSGVTVLRNVDFELNTGAVHALVGENGSGKSTLIRILTGALRPSRGRLELAREPIVLRSPADAVRLGIGVVHQDYNLFPHMTVAETVVGLSRAAPRRRMIPFLDRAAASRVTARLLNELGAETSPDTPIRMLDAAERKFVEIARAMVMAPQLLILDEPTASLGPPEAARVLALIDRLRSRGVGVCFVSHRLDEVVRIADQVTVLRDGRRVGHTNSGDVSEQRLAELMVGRKLGKGSLRAGDSSTPTEAKVLAMWDVRLRPRSASVALELREGEILGLTGLVGAGANDIVRMVGGAVPMRGTLEFRGRKTRVSSPQDAVALGIGYIPEDRKATGLVADLSVALNISLASLDKACSRGFLRHRAALERAKEFQMAVDIRANSLTAPVRYLSGGNQQKVLLAKWLASGAQVLAIEEPTHGVDIGAKAQIHELLRRFVAKGGALLVASTDVREVLSLCDRVAVFRHGSLAALSTPSGLTVSDLTLMGVTDGAVLLQEFSGDRG